MSLVLVDSHFDHGCLETQYVESAAVLSENKSCEVNVGYYLIYSFFVNSGKSNVNRLAST